MSEELRLSWLDTWLRMWYSLEGEVGEKPGRSRCILGDGVYLTSLEGRTVKVEGISAEVKAGEDQVWWIAGTRVTLVGSGGMGTSTAG